jgi:cytochrome c peroxidase
LRVIGSDFPIRAAIRNHELTIWTLQNMIKHRIDQDARAAANERAAASRLSPRGFRNRSLERLAARLLLPTALYCGLAACSDNDPAPANVAGAAGATSGGGGTAGGARGGASNGGGTASNGGGASDAGSNEAGASGEAGAPPRADSAAATRRLIGAAVGGIEKLLVPPDDAAIPVPVPADAKQPNRYKTTPAKKYLGKLLFHDPVRTARVNKNSGQPLDLPAGTAFGGTFDATVPQATTDAIVAATFQTGSCGSCHIGEAAGKAGQQLNFNTGGEGRGYTDQNGNYIPRRRAQAILKKFRTEPLFPGDALVDVLPTLTDIFALNGVRTVTTPALFYHTSTANSTPPGTDTLTLTASGRLDQLDSVGRQSPSMIGFAFNNRLLLGGFAGEPPTVAGGINPFNDAAQENLNLLLLDAHRMLGFQAAELIKIPAFVKLFRDAFPEEAAQADAAKPPDLTLLVNDVTEFRAQATFLRTVVTRDTPYDRFLAGNDRALSPSQLRGARLFFSKASDGGAGCFSCHSGPMLNKQVDDPDVAGIGKFVAENFINVGTGDHPLQALNAAARGHSTAYHAEDTGRMEITHDPNDAFKFRSVTLRQLKDARTFFHGGSFSKVRDVVSYFNAGIPQDPTAGSAGTLDPRFSHPRGASALPGLGLSESEVDDLSDFLENGLYDPSFAKSFQPTEDDLNYSKNRPDLAALGAKDGMLLSGLAIDDNDPLARRDQGLEFLDVTSRATLSVNSSGAEDQWLITNTSDAPIDTHLLVLVDGLPAGVRITNTTTNTIGGVPITNTATKTSSGKPYFRLFLPDGVLNPGQSVGLSVVRSGGTSSSYTLQLISGQGKP